MTDLVTRLGDAWKTLDPTDHDPVPSEIGVASMLLAETAHALEMIREIAWRLCRGHHSEVYGPHYYAIDCDACQVQTLARQIIVTSGFEGDIWPAPVHAAPLAADLRVLIGKIKAGEFVLDNRDNDELAQIARAADEIDRHAGSPP